MREEESGRKCKSRKREQRESGQENDPGWGRGQWPKWKEGKGDPEGKGAVASRGEPEGERNERKAHRLRGL